MRALLMLGLFCYTLFGMGGFLMPDEAFKPGARVEGDRLRVTIDLGESIYLYKEKIGIVLKDDRVRLGEIAYPPSDNHDGKEVFKGHVAIEAGLSKGTDAVNEIVAVLRYQGCSEKGVCYEPVEKSFVLPVDASKLPGAAAPQQRSALAGTAAASETDTIAQTFKNGSIPLVLLTFFGFGLLLALTPCVFPMIPILSSIIVSQGEGMNAKKGFILSLIYVLAMSVAYTFAGILAGLFGSNIQAAMQNPWVISAFALLFVALAFSMFGFFEIGLPSSLQSRLSSTSQKAGNRGGFAGVAVMGFLSALIVGPCVAPPLAGALLYIGQSGNALLGGSALFVMSLGMGVPLLLIGIGAGKFMPRPGGWMRTVSKVFGVIMLGIAIWMLQRVLPASVTMLLWALLLIVSSVYLGAFEALKENGRGWNALAKGGGVFVFLLGMTLLLGVLSGATNPLKPLERFTSGTAVAAAALQKPQNRFVKVHSIDEFDALMAKNRGKKVMLDFYADWCTSCQELEHNTFSDAPVQKALSDYVWVQADVTANSDEERALAAKFGVFGPPAILFFDENGKHMKSKTLVGYKPPETFLASIGVL